MPSPYPFDHRLPLPIGSSGRWLLFGVGRYIHDLDKYEVYGPWHVKFLQESRGTNKSSFPFKKIPHEYWNVYTQNLTNFTMNIGISTIVSVVLYQMMNKH